MLDRTEKEIMSTWQNSNPLVTIRCLAYNHEQYISQTLDGFLMQKTNYPFEILVHDDASTDNTATIIREYANKYPNVIKPIYQKENQYSKHDGTISRIMDSLTKGKYIAICEGDDYWINENKLQMQVDFLENNPEYGMCYTKAKSFFQDKSTFSKNTMGQYVKDFEDLLINGNRIPTLTTVYRKDILFNYNKEINPVGKGWLMGDLPKWLYIYYISKVKFFDSVTGVYRILEHSASHSPDISKQLKFVNSAYDIRNFFIDKYNLKYDLRLYYSRAILRTYATNLFQNYSTIVAREFRHYYKKSIYKSKKFYIYYLFSHFYLTWKIIKLLKNLLNN